MRKVFLIILILFVLIPLISWITWLLWPARPHNVLIIDKTSMTAGGEERLSFNWLLTYDKYTKPDGSTYSVSDDYLGFVPLQDENFRTRDLEQLSQLQIDSLAHHCDMTYYTDTYGVYRNDWYRRVTTTERSLLLYGGLHRNDVLFLEAMKRQPKLVIAEFNFIASPTRDSVRREVERMFDIHWTGWTGRYYSSLDTSNGDLPRWALRLYEQQNNTHWRFHTAGIILVHSSNLILVLENEIHLTDEIPRIFTHEQYHSLIETPDGLPYPYWFDITMSGPSNAVVAEYVLSPNEYGDSLLAKYKIPRVFPAVIEHVQDYKFYYFAGDFADNPMMNTFWAHFKGIIWLKKFFYVKTDLNDRSDFYWEYYLPMMRNIMERYYRDLHKKLGSI
jgi:hypothetical protein